MKPLLALGVLGSAALGWLQTPPVAPASDPIQIVLVGDSTVTEGSGWGLGFRELLGVGARVTNTAQNGREQTAVALEDPPDLPPPFPLLAGTIRSKPEERTLAMGRVYTRALRLERHARRLTHHGQQPNLAALPPLVTSPALIVAWDYVPRQPPPDVLCEFADGASSRVVISLPGDVPYHETRDVQPLTVIFDRARISEILTPYEDDVARVRFVAVLDPARLRAPSFLLWMPTAKCPDTPGTSPMETGALIAADDIARWQDRPASRP